MINTGLTLYIFVFWFKNFTQITQYMSYYGIFSVWKVPRVSWKWSLISRITNVVNEEKNDSELLVIDAEKFSLCLADTDHTKHLAGTFLVNQFFWTIPKVVLKKSCTIFFSTFRETDKLHRFFRRFYRVEQFLVPLIILPNLFGKWVYSEKEKYDLRRTNCFLFSRPCFLL